MRQVLNVGLLVERDKDQRQRLKIPTNKHSNELYSDSFIARGPKTFNALPQDLRNVKDSNYVYK